MSSEGRPAVDVVVPFAGSAGALAELIGRLAAAADGVGPADTVTLADNRPPGAPAATPPVGSRLRIVRATGRRSSYHARNVAARLGTAPWLLFLDADVEWSPAVLDCYLIPHPAGEIGVVGGGIADAPARGGGLAARSAPALATMDAARTLAAGGGRRPYAQTANALVRRTAFAAVGGFADGVRSAGDADLCWRIADAGWLVEGRPAAAVVHRNRATVAALLGQKLRHGAGAAWLDTVHPGSFPARRPLGLAWWSARRLLVGPDRAVAAIDVAGVWTFELGRRLPNGAPAGHR